MTTVVDRSPREGLEEKAGRTARPDDRPRVLVIDEEIPHPPNTGKRIRTINLLSRLSTEFAIDLLVHASGVTPEGIRRMEEIGVAVHVAPSRLRQKRGAGFYAALARNLVSPLPYSVVSHRHRAFQQTLDRLLATGKYGLVHCEWTPYAIYRRDDCVPSVISAHNIESDVWARMAEADSNPLRQWFTRGQAARMATFERRVFGGASHATAVSEGDAARLRSWGCRTVTVVPNGVDVEALLPLPEEDIEPSTLVFLGSLDWRPNQDAVRWFIEEVHPHLRRQMEYRLLVVGRRPPQWMKERKGVPPEVDIVGEVPSVLPYLARASVMVVPLRIGGGSRLKILEAFACGRAVVSTTVGAEGLEVVDGEHLRLADHPRRFASEVAEATMNAALRHRLSEAGRQLAEATYGWKRIARAQAYVWEQATAVLTG